MLHELAQMNLSQRVNICSSLIGRQEKQPFLDRIITGDEKWIVHNNVKRKRRWGVDKNTPPKIPCVKEGFAPRKDNALYMVGCERCLLL